MAALHYVSAVWRSWWVVLIAVVSGAGGSLYVFEHSTPLYQVKVQLVVRLTVPRLDPVSIPAIAGARALSLALVAPTRPAVSDAATKAGFPAAQPAVVATADPRQPFVNIVVSSANPRLAAAVADAFIHTLPATTLRLTGSESTRYSLVQLAPAEVPSDPAVPVFTDEVGFGLGGGLLIGIALALLREILNHSLRSSDDIRRASGLTVLGTIPRSTPTIPLPAVTEPRGARAEAYRQVRTTLLTARQKDRSARLAVTSSIMGEGKTSVTANVAGVLSRAGHSVAIVDADLRRPRVAEVFQIDAEFGLSDVLSRRASLEQALVLHDTLPLGIVAAGAVPSDPSELLGGTEFSELMDALGRRFDFVMVDTPPVLSVTDALAVSSRVDGIILVVRLGHTSRTQLRHSMAALERVDANVWGVVPNQAGRTTDSDYSYPYHYKHYGRDSRPRRRLATQIDLVGGVAIQPRQRVE